MSVREFQNIRAHYALADPQRRLEKEIGFQEAVEEIMADRAARAAAGVASGEPAEWKQR